MVSALNIAAIKAAVAKSRSDFTNRQKVDFEEVLKASEQEYLARMVDEVEQNETKNAVAESIRLQQAAEDEENKQLAADFFSNMR